MDVPGADRWAQVLFTTAAAAQRAEREPTWIDDDLGYRQELHVEMDTRTVAEQLNNEEADDMRKSYQSRQESLFEQCMKADALVAELTVTNFKELCVTTLSDVMEILTMQPKDRSVPQLTTLTKFLGATEFMQGMKSAMVQRNCCRFLTLSTFAPEELQGALLYCRLCLSFLSTCSVFFYKIYFGFGSFGSFG